MRGGTKPSLVRTVPRMAELCHMAKLHHAFQSSAAYMALKDVDQLRESGQPLK